MTTEKKIFNIANNKNILFEFFKRTRYFIFNNNALPNIYLVCDGKNVNPKKNLNIVISTFANLCISLC